MNLAHYRPPSLHSWTGRPDSLPGERFFQIVELVDLNSMRAIPPRHHTKIGLIGFACDLGIKRNLGRPGAVLGPQEFRKFFGNLARVPDLSFFDVGDVFCQDDNLERAQEDLGEVVKWALDNQLMPLVIGGGHEVSWGGYQGAAKSSGATIGIINFDAHFDLRPCGPAGGSSGTSFSQIADWCHQEGRPFDYLVLGLQPAANTASLFARAAELGATWLSAEELTINPSKAQAVLEKFLSRQTHIYLTLCLDVFAHAAAPGVSAPQSLGLWPQQLLPLLDQIMSSGKVLSMDLAEYSPPLDQQNLTGKLCASMVHTLVAKIAALQPVL